MKMYVDFEQYLLTASFLAPSVIVSYFVFYGLAKLLARFTRTTFKLSVLAHVGCIVVACATAPMIAVWIVDRPIDLMNGSGKSLLVGAIAAFAVVAMVEEIGRQRKESAKD